MAIKKLSIEGIRGFSSKTDIEFALPDGKHEGSGLTILVGPNNSGKSTVIEAIHLLTYNTRTVAKSIRNQNSENGILIEVLDSNNQRFSLSSTSNGGSYVQKKINDQVVDNSKKGGLNTFILNNKRGISLTFQSDYQQTRENYFSNVNSSEYRTPYNNQEFGGRLVNIYKNKQLFTNCLSKVLNPVPEWTLESNGENSSYLEFNFNGLKHGCNGAGDGFINIFNIVDALYDSEEDNIILIDEPEISLHPDLQKNLFKLLVEYSKDKQIIISTHSPYFIDWQLITHYSKIIRFRKENDCINLYELSNKSKKGIDTLLRDKNNIHTLGLDANNIFFLQDNVILTEGQDDVYYYPKIFEQYNYIPNASFFGWGAGGADKVNLILDILVDLGYQKVFTILDKDRQKKVKPLSETYQNYYFYATQAGDVHDKEQDERAVYLIDKINKCTMDISEKEFLIKIINDKFRKKKGLIERKTNPVVRDEFKDDILNLINKMKFYFEKDTTMDSAEKNESVSEDNTQNEQNSADYNIAQRILNNYLLDNNLHDYIDKKYNYLEFRFGSENELSLKQIKKNKYYVVVEVEMGISEECKIVVHFHFMIDTKKKKIKLKKEEVISNSLPKKY